MSDIANTRPMMRSLRRRLAAMLVVGIAAAVVYFFAANGQPPADVVAVRAFPHLQLRRPVVITGAGDGTDRIFVATGQGIIHVFPNDPDADETTVFLDIEEQVICDGETGLLGLAFHPDYQNNGEFFVFYTPTDPPRTSVISRFRVSADDANVADADSEDEILRIQRPSDRHNGGTLVFGPDGYLYIAVGDGGTIGDEAGHGQNAGTLLAAILRIDVNRQEDGKAYAIPPDNPLVNHPNARPEVWAYGLRNVWRMSFDHANGRLWAGDVGDDTWEEVNIIEPGGNYGWNVREGMHPFGTDGATAREALVEPVWEYHHDVGRCIVGGVVYRGQRIPELQGRYLFGDHVTNKVWALEYDEQRQRAARVTPILGTENAPVVTFGEDDAGEVYFTDLFGRIYTFASVEG